MLNVYAPNPISSVCGLLTTEMCFNNLFAKFIFLCGDFSVDNGLYMAFSFVVCESVGSQ